MKCLGMIVIHAAFALSIADARADIAINFESDPAHPISPPGDLAFYVSVDSPQVQFGGWGLEIADLGARSDKQALGSSRGFSSNTASIGFIIDPPYATKVSLQFGNDDPSFTSPGDLAQLSAVFAGEIVDVSTVVLNRDGILNQTVSVSGPRIARLEFGFISPSGGAFLNPNGLGEVIDNVNIQLVAIPEPEIYAMTLVGLGMLAVRCLRRSPSRLLRSSRW